MKREITQIPPLPPPPSAHLFSCHHVAGCFMLHEKLRPWQDASTGPCAVDCRRMEVSPQVATCRWRRGLWLKLLPFCLSLHSALHHAGSRMTGRIWLPVTSAIGFLFFARIKESRGVVCPSSKQCSDGSAAKIGGWYLWINSQAFFNPLVFNLFWSCKHMGKTHTKWDVTLQPFGIHAIAWYVCKDLTFNNQQMYYNNNQYLVN